MSVKVENLDKIINKLNNMSQSAVTEASKSVERNIKLIQAEAKTLCPVDTGALRNSIETEAKIEGNKITGEVFTNINYSAYVEFGTGQVGEQTSTDPVDVTYKQEWLGMKAQPFLYPAYKDNKDIVIKNISEDLTKIIKGR